MPFLNLTQQFIFRPDGTLGTDDDGSRDGRFLTGFAPDGFAWEDDIVYWTIHDCRPGHHVAPTNTPPDPLKYAISICWLRFHIPLPKDPDIVIDSAQLQLYWNPNLNRPIGHPDRDANINRGNPGHIRIGLVPNWPENRHYGKGPIPATSPQGNAMWNFIGTHGDGVFWDDNVTCCEQAEHVSAVLSADFGEQLQREWLEAPNWVIDDPVTFFLHINVDRPRTDMIREWHFRTWSWNAAFNNGNQSTAPRLLIEYHYDVPVPNMFTRSFVHDLLIYHEWDEITMSECVEHELFLTQDITVTHNHCRAVEHTILFEEQVAVGQVADLTVESLLLLEQDIGGWRERYPFVEHTIVFDHFWTSSSEKHQQIEHLILWVQTIDVVHVRCAEVEHEILFTHDPDFSEQHEKSVIHVLQIEHFWTIDHTEAQQVWHDLTITHEWTVNFSLNLSFEHTLGLTQVIVGLHCTDGDPTSTTCNRLELLYAPTVGPIPNKPTITLANTIQLDFPPTGATHTVTLPAPLHGDSEEVQVTRIQRKTKGGDLIVFAADSWPSFELRKFSFTGLTDTQRSDLFALMGASLGQLVRLQDHEGRTWDGVLVNPNGDFAQIYNQCGNTTEFWFQPVSEVTP